MDAIHLVQIVKSFWSCQMDWLCVHTATCLCVSACVYQRKKKPPAILRFKGFAKCWQVFSLQVLLASLSTGRSITTVMRVTAVVERRNHLRLVCNVLWKMHNFCAFTSELCSSTLLRLWANWAIRAVLYLETVFTGQTDKTSRIFVDKGEKNIVQQDCENTIAEYKKTIQRRYTLSEKTNRNQ